MPFRTGAIYFMAGLLMTLASATAAAEADPVEWLEVNRVGLYITTIVAIPCDSFTGTFANQLEQFQVRSKKDVGKFAGILRSLTPSSDNIPPDTRAKVLIHYKSGRVDTLCVSSTVISLNGKSMMFDEKMAKFIERVKRPKKK